MIVTETRSAIPGQAIEEAHDWVEFISSCNAFDDFMDDFGAEDETEFLEPEGHQIIVVLFPFAWC